MCTMAGTDGCLCNTYSCALWPAQMAICAGQRNTPSCAQWPSVASVPAIVHMSWPSVLATVYVSMCYIMAGTDGHLCWPQCT